MVERAYRSAGLTRDQWHEVLGRYTAGEGSHRIGRRIGRSGATVRRLLRAQGVAVRPPGKPRQYRLNEAAFSRRTPETAYWTGMMYADGWVNRYRSSHTFGLGLAVADRDHIRQFRSFLSSTHPIRTWTSHTFGGAWDLAVLVISSRRIFEALEAEGVVQNKTEYGRGIRAPLALSHDFWRGVLDGDGSIGGTVEAPALTLCGDLYIVQQFTVFARTIVPETRVRERQDKSIYTVTFGAGTARNLFRALYGHGALSLARKQRKATLLLRAWDAQTQEDPKKSSDADSPPPRPCARHRAS